MRYFLFCKRHSCIQKLILFIFIFLAFNVALSKSNETGIFSSPAFAQSCTPTLLGSINASGNELGLYVSGNTAYVTTRGNLHIINVTNPTGPVLLGSFGGSNEQGWDVYVSGDTAYYATRLGLYIIDVSDPKNPSWLGFKKTSNNADGIYVSNSTAYVAVDTEGIDINVGGVISIDVSNPTTPSLLGSYGVLSCRAEDVFVSGSTAYMVGGDCGLHIIDAGCAGCPTLPTDGIMDNGSQWTSSTGSWVPSSGPNPYGAGSLYSNTSGSYEYCASDVNGSKDVSLWWTEWSNRCTSVQVDIYDGSTNIGTVNVNQQANGCQWNSLGTYSFSGVGQRLLFWA